MMVLRIYLSLCVLVWREGVEEREFRRTKNHGTRRLCNCPCRPKMTGDLPGWPSAAARDQLEGYKCER